MSSRSRSLAGTVCGLLLLGSAGLVLADEPGIVLTVGVQKEVSVPGENGEVRVVRREVGAADPGDVLVYTLTYKNTSSAPVRDAVVNDPVPQGTTLLPGSIVAGNADVTVSVDGGRSFVPFPATLQVAGMGGSPVTKPAPADAYTHIRWTARGSMAPGETRTASFKVVVK
ncbi:MAG TPA: hypothetical protein VNI57_14610 [Candidatus Saccharimonadales bacterium]|nr:hypothetical protein [Candidatus Saccharimonadales bacterium]